MIDRYLAERLVGQDADDTERLWQDMWWHLHYAGRGGHLTSAISAVDIALWDLKGRRAGTPLWRYFGGFDPRVPVYAGGIDLDLSIGELIEQADRFQEAGFRAIKMKVGRPGLNADIERVRAMREHLGADFPLMVDANMKWSADQAVAAGRALREFDVLWLEEPTIPDDVAGHVRVVREGGIAVAAGENLHTLHEFRAVITAGGVTYRGAGRVQLRRHQRVPQGMRVGGGAQPAGDLARRARFDRASARRVAEPQLPGGARLQP